jgi:hypothetical protein
MELPEYLTGGGLKGLERAAAKKAIEQERWLWLSQLMTWAAELADMPLPEEKEAAIEHVTIAMAVSADLRRARRGLKLPERSAEERLVNRRVKTLERVRRFRDRRRSSPADRTEDD